MRNFKVISTQHKLPSTITSKWIVKEDGIDGVSDSVTTVKLQLDLCVSKKLEQCLFIPKLSFLVTRSFFNYYKELLKASLMMNLKFSPIYPVTSSLVLEIEYTVTRSVLQTLCPNRNHKQVYELYQNGKSLHVIKHHAIITDNRKFQCNVSQNIKYVSWNVIFVGRSLTSWMEFAYRLTVEVNQLIRRSHVWIKNWQNTESRWRKWETGLQRCLHYTIVHSQIWLVAVLLILTFLLYIAIFHVYWYLAQWS